MQLYMMGKSLEDSWLEFKWRTNMIDIRTTMKGKYSLGVHTGRTDRPA